MDMAWNPGIKIRTRVELPHVFVSYRLAVLEQWREASRMWQASKCTDYSVWGEYEEIAKSGRFILPYVNEAPSRRFPELHTALLLQREGFECWGGVQLFQYPIVGKGKGNARANTEDVRSKASWRWPSEIEYTLDFSPKNPDIVAYAAAREEWRFCEIKRDDPVAADQLKALAVIHLLTRAPVAVVRLVEGTTAPPPERLIVDVEFADGASLTWSK